VEFLLVARRERIVASRLPGRRDANTDVHALLFPVRTLSMTRITHLIDALDELLDPGAFSDLGPNGLQVPGGEEIERVVTGVTAQLALIERAIELDAQLVLVHHGLFWDFHPTGLTPVLARRLRLLFRHDVALAGYHLPLDAHPVVGNNALLAGRLGCERHEAWGDVRGRRIGRAATFAGDGIPAAELFTRVRELTGREPTVFAGGPERIRRIGIVSGSAAELLPAAVGAGFDAFLTGEPREHVMADALESGIHFLAAGHYATETFGIRALGDWLAERFGIDHVFVDLPNPV
jgi:dinuclear metal center YbgI/SA1388 family protein